VQVLDDSERDLASMVGQRQLAKADKRGEWRMRKGHRTERTNNGTAGSGCHQIVGSTQKERGETGHNCLLLNEARCGVFICKTEDRYSTH
jgi:hypothetical protein